MCQLRQLLHRQETMHCTITTHIIFDSVWQLLNMPTYLQVKTDSGSSVTWLDKLINCYNSQLFRLFYENITKLPNGNKVVSFVNFRCGAIPGISSSSRNRFLTPQRYRLAALSTTTIWTQHVSVMSRHWWSIGLNLLNFRWSCGTVTTAPRYLSNVCLLHYKFRTACKHMKSISTQLYH